MELTAASPEARAAGPALVKEGIGADGKRKTFIYVNNRLESNALGSIAAMLEGSKVG